MLAKFPFNPSAVVDATPQDVGQLLRPGTGALWTFYNEALQPLLQKQGASYVPQGSGTRLTSGFITFFNKLASLSEAMFKATPEPRLQFQVEPQLTAGIQAVTLTVDGEPVRSSRNRESRKFTWPRSGRESKLTVQVGSGAELVLAGPHQGSWGFLRTFYEADPGQSVGTSHRAEWSRAKSRRHTAARCTDRRRRDRASGDPDVPSGALCGDGLPGDHGAVARHHAPIPNDGQSSPTGHALHFGSRASQI